MSLYSTIFTSPNQSINQFAYHIKNDYDDCVYPVVMEKPTGPQNTQEDGTVVFSGLVNIGLTFDNTNIS